MAIDVIGYDKGINRATRKETILGVPLRGDYYYNLNRKVKLTELARTF